MRHDAHASRAAELSNRAQMNAMFCDAPQSSKERRGLGLTIKAFQGGLPRSRCLTSWTFV